MKRKKDAGGGRSINWCFFIYLALVVDNNYNCSIPCRPCVLCNARKRTHDTYLEREGACPGVSGMAATCAELSRTAEMLLVE